MDWKTLTRDPSKVRAACRVQGEQVLALKRVCIYLPERFVEKQLVRIGTETYIVGIYAMTVDDKYYAVSRINARMQVKPSVINTVKFGEDSYLEFVFEPGSVIIVSTKLLVQDVLTYEIYDEFMAKGNVPWYIQYDDLARLFETADYHAGVSMGKSHAILGMVAAAITRTAQDRAQYYRHALRTQADVGKIESAVIPLRSVSYGTTNTTTRLVGSYWNDGLTSALVNPSTKTENIEELLRK